MATYPNTGDVRAGVQYGPNDTDYQGTLDLPAEADVRDGIKYDGMAKEGTIDLPIMADVRDGVTFDAGTQEGALDLPQDYDVRDDVLYDSGTKTGTLTVPADTDVRYGVTYDPHNSRTGKVDLPATGDVKSGIQYDNLSKTGTYLAVADYPDEDDVRAYVEYADSTMEGKLDLPATIDVRYGTAYDQSTKQGACKIPPQGDVRLGVDVDQQLGTLDLPDVADVKDGVHYDNNLKEGSYDPVASAVFPAEANVSSVETGYGPTGTEYAGSLEMSFYTLKANIVLPQYVLTGNDTYTGGDAGTLTLPAPSNVSTVETAYGAGGTGSAGELDLTDYVLKIAVASANDVRFGTDRYVGGPPGALVVPDASKVLYGEPVDFTTGTLTLPAEADVFFGTGDYGVGGTGSTPAMRASDIASCEAGNIKKDVIIDDVTGTYEGSGGGSTIFAGGYLMLEGPRTYASVTPGSSDLSNYQNIRYIQVAASGTVNVTDVDGNTATLYFAAGGWHQFNAKKITSGGTATGIVVGW